MKKKLQQTVLATLWKSCSQRRLCVPQHGEQMARPGRHGCLEEKRCVCVWAGSHAPRCVLRSHRTKSERRSVCLRVSACCLVCFCVFLLKLCVISQSNPPPPPFLKAPNMLASWMTEKWRGFIHAGTWSRGTRKVTHAHFLLEK